MFLTSDEDLQVSAELTFKCFFVAISVTLSFSIHGMDCAEFSELLSRKTGIYIEPDRLKLNKATASFVPPIHATPDPYWSTISEARSEVESAIGGTESPGKVLYLFSGWDAGLPATFFPHSTVNIGLAMVPFVPSTPYPRIPFSLEPGTPWVHTNTVIQTPVLAAKILGNLKSAVPQMRVLDVYSFERRFLFGKVPRPSVEDQLDGVANEELLDFWKLGGGTHGAVRYDTGEGTPERWYFHFDAFIDGEKMNWYNVLQIKPDALIVKASAGSLTPTNQARLVEGLTQHLMKVQGTLLEGCNDSFYRSGFEFSGRRSIENGRTCILHVPFGYQDTSATHGTGQVIHFAAPKK